jgi:hypothetical protein
MENDRGRGEIMSRSLQAGSNRCAFVGFQTSNAPPAPEHLTSRRRPFRPPYVIASDRPCEPLQLMRGDRAHHRGDRWPQPGSQQQQGPVHDASTPIGGITSNGFVRLSSSSPRARRARESVAAVAQAKQPSRVEEGGHDTRAQPLSRRADGVAAMGGGSSGAPLDSLQRARRQPCRPFLTEVAWGLAQQAIHCYWLLAKSTINQCARVSLRA